MKNQPTAPFAIAMEYDGDQAPKITARGFHETAEEILRQAHEAGVPVHQDSALTALLTDLDIGDRIPNELYLIIAEILSFAYQVSGKHKPFMDDLMASRSADSQL